LEGIDMGSNKIPGPMGLQGGDTRPANVMSPGHGSFSSAVPLGIEGEPLTDRFVTKVDCDWVPTPKPDTTPIVVKAANLKELAAALSQLPEAGKGGGQLRAGGVPAGTSPDVTVSLQGNLVNRVVQWDGYDQASAAAKAHWDTVLNNLKRHEKRHMEIAIEVGDELAKALVGHKIGSTPSIGDKVTAANTRMQKLQDDLDSAAESDHGRKKGHAFGDCNIDTSIQ
jgi:hypothetical protein